MEPVEGGMSPEQRLRLALKGQRLYHKFCGAKKGTCAESFARFHIRRGESEVARDLLAFLDGQLDALKKSDPEGRLTKTEQLAARIQVLLDGGQ